MLRIDSNLIWIIVNLIIFYLLIRKFLFKPVLGMIEKRKKMIEDQFAAADETNAQANELKQKYEASLGGAKEESQKIIASARERGHAEYQEIIDKAQTEADRMLKDANVNVAREREKALQDVQTEIANLAMAAAAKIIGEANTPELDKELYSEFLTKAGKSNDANGN